LNFDEILTNDLDEFGAYQKKTYFWICLPSISAGFHMLISVFLLATQDYRYGKKL
jgi:hypothetical protein